MNAIVVRLAATLLLLSGSLAVHAQQTARVFRIGLVADAPGASTEAYQQGLRELGYIEGRNVVIEERYAEGHSERLEGLFAELVRSKVEVLMVTAPVLATAKKAVTTIPVVFGGVIDPVAAGIVASLARPGGNITGTSVGVGGLDFTMKCFQLLKEATPGLSHVAVLLDPQNYLSPRFAGEVPVMARALGLKLEVFEAANAAGLNKALAAIGTSGAQGIFVAPSPFLTASSPTIARFASSRRLPALHFSKRFADTGGLMSYGASLEDSYRRAARHVDKILKGAKPADLPIDQPTRFELVINMKTARAIGLRVPQSMLLRADHVIE